MAASFSPPSLSPICQGVAISGVAEAGIDEGFRSEGPALDDLDGGICRERRGRLRGGGRVGGGCRVERGRRKVFVQDCVGCNQMSEGSLKSSRHVDGYISGSVSVYILQTA